jgi:hypothetical protein
MTIATTQIAVTAQPECRFVEILTTENSGENIGYRYGGSFPGPNALIAGTSALIEALTDQLDQLPTLPWMWGKLYLVKIDGIELLDICDAESALAHVRFDEVILLPHTKGFGNWQATVDQAYWTTLKLCRRLGMIAGRGVYD